MSGASFSERDFYQREFRGRTLLLVAAEPLDASDQAALRAACDVLVSGGARVVVASPDSKVLAALGAQPVLDAAHPKLEGLTWRALDEQPQLGLTLPPPMGAAQGAGAAGVVEQAGWVALRLGVFKLVWLSRQGGLATRAGQRQSFVHGEALRALLTEPQALLADATRLPLWRLIVGLLEAGVPTINVCSASGLDAELFSYAGTGTLFTRERYIRVRRLGLDDYDGAAALLERGAREGYLLPRDAAGTDAVLASGFGAFIEERHLAGVAALLRCGESALGELAGLYTLTRFLGEGVGPHLLDFACVRARECGFDAVFACTADERVSAFFERQGFARVAKDSLPAAKWRGYDPERRQKLHCHLRQVR